MGVPGSRYVSKGISTSYGDTGHGLEYGALTRQPVATNGEPRFEDTMTDAIGPDAIEEFESLFEMNGSHWRL